MEESSEEGYQEEGSSEVLKFIRKDGCLEEESSEVLKFGRKDECFEGRKKKRNCRVRNLQVWMKKVWTFRRKAVWK